MKFQIQELRPEVLAFALMMEQRLREKDAARGDGYKQATEGELLIPATAKCLALDRAMQADDRDGLIKHAVDLGNYSMMIAHAAGALEVPDESRNDEILEIPAFLRAHRDE